MNNPRDYTGFSVKDAIMTIACALLSAVTLSACNDSTNTPPAPSATPAQITPPTEEFSLNSLLDSIQGAKSGVEEVVGPHAEAVQERTKEEVEKLFRWEYKVVEFPTDIAAIELEVKLGDLGAQGWECFHFQAQSPNLTRVTCKRKPKSALSYLKFIPGL